MAGSLMDMGGRVTTNVCTFIVDSENEVDFLPTTTRKGTGIFANDPNFNMYAPIGSVCQVGNDGGDLLIYELFSFGWKKIS